MDLWIAIIIGTLLANLIVTFWLVRYLRRSRQGESSDRFESLMQSLKSDLLQKQFEGLVSLRESLDSANSLINDRLAEGNSAFNERLKLFGDIDIKLGELKRQTSSIERIGRNIQSLSDLLKPPKLRGRVGEMLLENLIEQIIPRQLYDFQYRLAGGQIVDLVVRVGDKFLPIDSKFPLESYLRTNADPSDESASKEFIRTVKKHIDDISDKYIRPEENTTDVALMYIPSEAVYYRFVSDAEGDGLDYALSKKVIPSSPGHLYSFLASLSAVYRQTGLLKGRRELAAGIDDLSGMIGKLSRFHERMEGSLRSMRHSFDGARQTTTAISGRLESMQSPPEEVEAYPAGKE